ncbi:MAG: sulfurtransferase complex subunit TusD [Oceanospirillaceae bacterium]|nr:sulfurtransferase complex subunit TusD [Oceanospirillaceae bacterium]
MIFSILIYASSNSSQTEQSALRFTRAVLQQGHSIHRVFFYGESVNACSNLIVTPRDETNITEQWLTLASAAKLDMVVCISAAVRRGILDGAEAKRHNKSSANLSEGFQLSGLGQLADAIIMSDRTITFGN